MDKLVYQGGPILRKAVVVPIFWGQEWNLPNNNQSATKVVSDLNQLLAGPYMLGLGQYMNIAPASIFPPIFDPSSQPPNPVTLDGLGAFVKDLLAVAKIPDFRANDQLLYFIFTNGYQFQDPKDAGYHYWGQLDGKTFHYAWAQSPETWIASHEIIEAVTDPEATGFFQLGNGIEVGDICELIPDAYGASDGIVAASYWSNIGATCILPTRVGKIAVFTADKDECHIGPAVGKQSKFTVTFGVDPSWIDGSNLPPIPNAQYVWSFDPKVAAPVSVTSAPTLVLKWVASSGQPTTITVTVNNPQGITLKATISVRVHSASEADLLEVACHLRQIINSVNRIPPFLVHKLGPDPAPLPTERDIEQLNAFASSISHQVEQITRMNKNLKR